MRDYIVFSLSFFSEHPVDYNVRFVKGRSVPRFDCVQ